MFVKYFHNMKLLEITCELIDRFLKSLTWNCSLDVFNNFYFFSICSTGGGSMLGDVNISAILDSFSVSYDKRVRPNYGGKYERFGIPHHIYYLHIYRQNQFINTTTEAS